MVKGRAPRLLLSPHPEALLAAGREFRSLQQRFEQGDNSALLLAVLDWLHLSVPPDWVKENFAERFFAWYFYDTMTLDAAFGVERPKRYRRNPRRLRSKLRPVIVFLVEQLHAQEGLPLGTGAEVFDRVGDMLGVKGRYVGAVYYERASTIHRKVFPHFVSWHLTIPKNWLRQLGLKPRVQVKSS